VRVKNKPHVGGLKHAFNPGSTVSVPDLGSRDRNVVLVRRGLVGETQGGAGDLE
jgi:hypothetical protein